MKQLNWWQGLWRVWVIGTVAWAAVTFWKSNPRCLIIDGDRWCYYRSDFELLRLVACSDVRLASADRHTSSCIGVGLSPGFWCRINQADTGSSSVFCL
jgi:hypothetical protein